MTELTGFPGTKYDDQVDSTTQALSYLNVPSVLEIWRRLGEAGLTQAMIERLECAIGSEFEHARATKRTLFTKGQERSFY